jgi:hypothetical protein
MSLSGHRIRLEIFSSKFPALRRKEQHRRRIWAARPRQASAYILIVDGQATIAPTFSVGTTVVLLGAGALAGIIGSAGGITSLVSYPALLPVGIPPLPAKRREPRRRSRCARVCPGARTLAAHHLI